MTVRLRDRARDADPVVARAASLLGAVPSIADSAGQRERVARRIAVADGGGRRWRRWVVAACATGLVAMGAAAGWRWWRQAPAAAVADAQARKVPDQMMRGLRAVVRAAHAPLVSPPAPTIPAALSEAPGARPEDLLWANDHEADALGRWTLGAPALGGSFGGRRSTYAVTTERAHSGQSSLLFTSDTSAGREATAQAFRNGFLPEEGYYSAWFLLPHRYTIPEEDYWAIMVFRSKRPGTRDGATADQLFVVNLMNDPAGEMGLEVWDPTSKQFFRPERPAPIAAGKWFHVEVFLRATNDGAGQFVLWQDGQEVIRREHLPMPPRHYLHWALGSSARRLSPALGVVFVDDAAVSRTRLGPRAPLSLYRTPD